MKQEGISVCKSNIKKQKFFNRPVLFIMGTFMLIWCCTGFMTKINADTHSIIYTFLDFIESASPLFFNFYLFQVEDAEFSVQTFAVTFCMRQNRVQK